jgi:hypothetical protein
MFSVCVCVCVFLCLCTARGLETSWSPVQGVLPTVPDQETEETQPYIPKAGASSQVWEQRGRKKVTTLSWSFVLYHFRIGIFTFNKFRFGFLSTDYIQWTVVYGRVSPFNEAIHRYGVSLSSGEHSLNINMAIHSVAERGALNSATLPIDSKQRLGLLKLLAETTKTSWGPEWDHIHKGQDRKMFLCCSFVTWRNYQ